MKFSPLKLGKAHIGIQGLIKEPWRLEKLGPRAEDLMYLPIPSTKQSSSWDDSLYTTAINIKKNNTNCKKALPMRYMIRKTSMMLDHDCIAKYTYQYTMIKIYQITKKENIRTTIQ